MNIYTEEQIKKYFEIMKKKYPNSNMYNYLKSIEYLMFGDSFDDTDTLNFVLKNLDK